MNTKIINGHPHTRYQGLDYSINEIEKRSKDFFELMDKRRSIRNFSDRPVPEEIIKEIIQTASTAPSGAHKQPWYFCAISSAKIKAEIRKAAEKEEYDSYHGRISDRWLKDLEPIGTDWHKPFIETAPWIIVVFKKIYDTQDNIKLNNYYVNESVGIACGMLIAAIHQAGLVTLTHTPSPMNFLSTILGRPENERPYLLMPVGFPAEDAHVPNLKRKPLVEICSFYK